MNILKDMKKSLLTSAVVYLILGLVMIVWPQFVNDFFSTIVGVLILLFGVSQLGSYSSKKSYNTFASFTLGLGIIATGIGIYILLNPKFIISIIPVISGLVIIINAIKKIKQASELKTSNYDKWWYNLVSAIIFLILGCILIANPFKVVTVIIRVFGIILVADAIYDILTVNSYSKEVKKVIKTIK